MTKWLLKLATGNPLVLLYIAGGILAFGLAAGTSTGWTLNGWRLNAKIGPLQAEVSRLQSRGAILENANAQCSKSVGAANEATGRLIAAGKAREKMAQEAIRIAKGKAAGLATSIATLRAMPKPVGPPDELCAQARGILADEVRSRTAP